MNKFKCQEQIISMFPSICNPSNFNSIFESVETIQVLYYLEKYNPNVTLATLSSDLNIDIKILTGLIKNLLMCELVVYREADKQYNLTDYGENIVKSLHQIST